MMQPPPLSLPPAERRRAQHLMILEGMIWTIMYTSIFGVALTGLALALGAPAWQIGLLTTIPAFMRLVQITAPRLMRPGAGRKRMAVGGLVGARLFNLPIMLLPVLAWLWPGANPLWFWLLLGLVMAYNTLDAVGAVAWLSWATDVVPPSERGRYWARRGVLVGLISLVTAPAVGWVLDQGQALTVGTIWAGHPHPLAFALVFGVGAAAGAVTAWLLARTPHAPLAAGPPARAGVIGPVREALADPLLRRYITARTIWSFGIWLALPFVNVYLLQTLQLDFTAVTLLTAGQTLLTLLSLPLWGRAVDRWGCRPVVIMSTATRAISVGLLALTAPGVPWLWPLLLLQFPLAGVADAGLQLGVGNLLMKLAPRADPAYFAAFNTITGFSAAVGPLLASGLLAVVGSQVLQIGGLVIGPLQGCFLLTALIGLGSLTWLRGFHEPQDTAEALPTTEPSPV